MLAQKTGLQFHKIIAEGGEKLCPLPEGVRRDILRVTPIS
jgi:hypothetical protein